MLKPEGDAETYQCRSAEEIAVPLNCGGKLKLAARKSRDMCSIKAKAEKIWLPAGRAVSACDAAEESPATNVSPRTVRIKWLKPLASVQYS